MAKRTICKRTISEDNKTLTLDFGEAGKTDIAVTDFNSDMLTKLAVYGISQKIGDSFAGAESPEAAQAIANATLERLKSGDWTTRREGGGGARISQLVEALARVTGKETDECLDVVAGMADDDKKALRANPQIKAALETIKAERQAAKARNAAKEAEGESFDLNSLMG